MAKEENRKKFDKKNFKRNRRNDDKREPENKDLKLSMNDPSWYVLRPELLRDVASLPFAHWLGKGFNIDKAFNTHESTMLILPFYFTLGVSLDASSPVNLAIRNLYTYVRHQNSGHTNYESADLGLYLLSVGSIIACLSHVERCIGLAKCYQRRNALMPNSLLGALGVNNTVSFTQNLANWTARLNIAWQRVSSLCIPKDFKFIQRWIWMCSQVFKDHESDKAALIAFKPVSVPKFDALSAGTGGCILQDNNDSGIDIANFMDDVENAITRVLADEDMNIMSGDILKAYGAENCVQFGMTPIDYVYTPKYVEEMLPQIQHAQCLLPVTTTSNGVAGGKLVTTIPYSIATAFNDQTLGIYTLAQDNTKFVIYQCNGEIVCAPANISSAGTGTIVTSTGELYWSQPNIASRPVKRILTSYKENPQPEDVMLSTRLMFNMGKVEAAGSGNGITSCGTEIVKEFRLYVSYVNPNAVVSVMQVVTDVLPSTTATVLKYLGELIIDMAQIDWHPLLYYYDGVNLSNSGITHIGGDVDNFTIIDDTLIETLNLSAVLAEFSVAKYNLINN